METRIRPKGSQVHCYKCGSPDIASICHHCGRPMCSRHGPVKPILRWFTENREFTKLNLGTWPLRDPNGAHCEYHVHSQLNYRRIMIAPGTLIGLAGLILLVVSALNLGSCVANWPQDMQPMLQGWAEVLRAPQGYGGIKQTACYMPSLVDRILALVQALLVLGLGIGLITSGRRLNKENIDADIKEQGITLPVGPHTNSIRVTERINLQLQIDENGTATSRIIGGVEGKIDPAFQFASQDRERIKEYKSKYQIASSENLSFQGGYLVLKGDPFIRIVSETGKPDIKITNPDPTYKPPSSNLLRLDGKLFDHNFLLGRAGKSKVAWQRTWTYKVEDNVSNITAEDIASAGSPVWVLPILEEHGKIKSLALVVQLDTGYFQSLTEILMKDDLRPENKVWIERVKLSLNHREFGYPDVKGAIVSKYEDGNQDQSYEVEWHGAYFDFDKENPPGKYLVFTGFQLKLEKDIPSGAHLCGKIDLRVPSLVSSIKNVQYYSALGNHVFPRRNSSEEIPQVKFTYIHADFDLALAKIAQSRFVSLRCMDFELSGPPTPKRLTHILNTFHREESSIFIDSVEESQPKLGDEKSKAGRWHWQITGRQYHGFMPIAFHMVMYGHGNQDENGRTCIETSIVATVDENTRELVDMTKKNIEHILKEAIKSEAGQLEAA